MTTSKKAARNVCIATPSRDDRFTGEYVRFLYRLLSRSSANGIDYTYAKVAYVDVEHARNLLVSSFYFNQPNCSHILFVDDDMGFEPELVERMLDLDEEVVGAICHKRTIDLKKLHSLGELPFSQALAKSLEFIGRPKFKAERKDGFVTVKSCGSGILLVSRSAISTMIEKIPSIVGKSNHPGLEKFLQPFDKIKEGDTQFSEDMSFCKRWTEQCTGKIWASTASPVSHVGSITLTSRFDDLTAPSSNAR